MCTRSLDDLCHGNIVQVDLPASLERITIYNSSKGIGRLFKECGGIRDRKLLILAREINHRCSGSRAVQISEDITTPHVSRGLRPHRNVVRLAGNHSDGLLDPVCE